MTAPDPSAAFAVSLLAILGFVLAFRGLGVAAIARDALAHAGAGASAMLDAGLSDAQKEAAVRAAGLALLAGAWAIFWRFAACLLAAALPIYAIGLTGLVPAEAVLDLMTRWDFLIGTTVALLALAWALSRGRAAPASGYSFSDQLTHRLAFAGPGVQIAASEIEDRLYRATLREIPDRPPVFITSLPRAGTTVLLNALHGLPGVATHLYRDMPFLTAPLLWARLRGRSMQAAELTERAHGDGLMVGYDSPEAFEEALWRLFWPEKFGPGIALWDAADAKPEATAFLTRHFRKIVALRTAGAGRYVSKNNGNIARLGLLPAMFPGCAIVVPIRDPAEHAASLLRQHLNFGAMHRADPFVARYMRDIGHLEFGEIHAPIAFPGFEPRGLTPEDPDYWLAYWIAAYRCVLVHAPGLHLVTQATACARPNPTLRALCAATGLDSAGHDFATHFRPIEARADRAAFDRNRLAEAEVLFADLQAREIVVP